MNQNLMDESKFDSSWQIDQSGIFCNCRKSKCSTNQCVCKSHVLNCTDLYNFNECKSIDEWNKEGIVKEDEDAISDKEEDEEEKEEDQWI